MMKLIVVALLIVGILQANVTIKQNMKALYHNVKISDQEKDYILENEEENIKRIEHTSKQRTSDLKRKTIKEKNVIEFTLKKDGKIKNIKFLSRSDERKIDDKTKEIIKNTKFITPNQDTKMRYIFIYEFGKNKIYAANNNFNNVNKVTKQDNEPRYETIQRGTTRFNYSMDEYARVFETTMDGFANITTSGMCARITLLTFKNQRISNTLYNPYAINSAIKKGKYKLLINTKKDCDINIQYP